MLSLSQCTWGCSFLGFSGTAYPCGWCILPLLPLFTPSLQAAWALGSDTQAPIPHSSSLSLTGHPRSALTPLTAGCAGEDEEKCLCAFSSLDPCTFPHSPLLLPSLCLPGARHVGSGGGNSTGEPCSPPTLLPVPGYFHSPQISLDLQSHRCLPPCVVASGGPAPTRWLCRAAWQGTWASPHPLSASVSPSVRTVMIVAASQVVSGVW